MTIHHDQEHTFRRHGAAPLGSLMETRPIIDVYEATIPDLNAEFQATLRELISATEPRTVTHALLLNRERPPTREEIAVVIGRATFEIEGVLAALEESGWVVRFTENGLEKFALRAPLSPGRSALGRL